MVVCDVGTLPAGGGAEVRVTATVTAPAGATLTAVAAAVSATHDPGGQPGVATLASPVIAP